MTELDLAAIETRATAGVRQTTADTDVLALVARVRELEQKITRVREVLAAEEAAVTAAAIDYGAMLPRTVEIDDILTALEDPS
ncbi:hypothetical protein [Gordonia sp. AC31]|uniref:hypothetical protein n=1 Tax=Gordonia sp. AC31 TaxID=2962571 RepID=UPI002882B24D|nr:hypothetical protein [Gordonia sp. AC31]MDT0223483.1 hypothetical protein [Gordonia sp. AC31]